MAGIRPNQLSLINKNTVKKHSLSVIPAQAGMAASKFFN